MIIKKFGLSDIITAIQDYLDNKIEKKDLATFAFENIASDQVEFETLNKELIIEVLHILSVMDDGESFEMSNSELLEIVKILIKDISPSMKIDYINKLIRTGR
jgi:hypothetical protein